MNDLSIIIPSKNFRNVKACVEAIHQNGSGRIIIVDDGVEWELAPQDASRLSAYDSWFGARVMPGVQPFVFARNVNLGIQAAGTDDVIVLNDDALLQTPGGFAAMQQQAYEHPEFGIIASTCNNVGNRNQWQRPGNALREEPRMVCFVCVLIPRSTIDRVGLLDERYVDYGCDDDDYSFEVRKAGLKLGIFDGCYVDHGSLTSSYRGEAGAGGNFLPNLQRFIAKWGHDNWGRPRESSSFRHLFPAA